MESALSIWRSRAGDEWIAGCDMAAFRATVETRRRQMADTAGSAANGARVRVLEIERDPVAFVAGVLAALTAASSDLFLGNSRWTAAESALAASQSRPQIVWGEATAGAVAAGPSAAPGFGTAIWIPTGGTTGGLRFAGHNWQTLSAAAHGLQRWLGGPVHSVCFLPLHHVSGLMQVVRAFVTGGRLALAAWDEIEAGRFPPLPAAGAVTSLVPTQLARLLERPAAVEWLRGFRAIFLGGAAAWPELLERARARRLPLAPCYGTTETAAQVVAMAPEEFLSGREGVGRALPHAAIDLVDPTGAVMKPGEPGLIRVRAPSLFFGYWPAAGAAAELVTGDRGSMSGDGFLRVLGRADAVINTGGEKVDPAEIEAAIRATGLVDDVAVAGVPDSEWGEAVVAVVAAAGSAGGNDAAMIARLRTILAPHKVPKRIVRVPALPRNDAGKLDRATLLALAAVAPEEARLQCRVDGATRPIDDRTFPASGPSP